MSKDLKKDRANQVKVQRSVFWEEGTNNNISWLRGANEDGIAEDKRLVCLHLGGGLPSERGQPPFLP